MTSMPDGAIHVLFNDLEEFIKELQLNRVNMRLPVLRATQQFTRSGQLPLLSVSVVAGYLFERGYLHLACLTCPCGEVMTGEPYSKSAAGKSATAAMAKLTAAAAVLELEVRAGTFKLAAP